MALYLSQCGLEGAHIPSVCAAVSDCVMQLGILGGLAPERRGDVETVVGSELKHMATQQQSMELQYGQLAATRAVLRQGKGTVGSNLESVEKEMTQLAGELKHTAHVLTVNLRQNPGAAENLLKLQAELTVLRGVMEAGVCEMDERGTFKTLVDAVVAAARDKEAFTQLVARDEEGRAALKALRAQSQEVQESQERTVKEKDLLVRQLKDQLQELRTQSSSEIKYMKKETAMKLAIAQKGLNSKSKALSNEAAELQRLIEEENKVNLEVEEFLRTNYKTLTEKLDFWMNKSEKDNEDAQRRLDGLKADRSRDLLRLQELTEKYNEFERVVEDDRIRKEKQARAAQQAVLELAAAIRLQAWWRGMMVRHKLGPFKPSKKTSKGKKGKKK